MTRLVGVGNYARSSGRLATSGDSEILAYIRYDTRGAIAPSSAEPASALGLGDCKPSGKAQERDSDRLYRSQWLELQEKLRKMN